MKRILLATALLACALPASAAPFDFSFGWSESRGRGEVGRDGDGPFVNLRRNFGEIHAVELEYARTGFEPGDRDYFGLHWVKTNPEPLWRPFFLLGLGASDGPEGSGALASVGIGGRWQLVPGRIDLRADLRYRHDSAAADDARNEGVLMIGVSLPLGR